MQGAHRPHHRDLMISWRLRQYPLAWAHVTLRRKEVVVVVVVVTAAMGAVHRADGQGADGAHAGASNRGGCAGFIQLQPASSSVTVTISNIYLVTVRLIA